MGSKDLKGMDQGRVDPSGRSLTQIGKLFGIGSMVLWGLSAGCVAMLMSVRTIESSMTSMGDDTRATKVYFTSFPGSQAQALVEYEYQEIQLPGGEWLRDGPATRWSRSGSKLEEGSYRDGKREGMWTFWNEDGSIDGSKTGLYENDVLVQAMPPSPLITW
jgi:hypothetical protein